MNQLNFSVPTEPIPQARPRFGNGRVYQSARCRDFREQVRLCALAEMHGRAPMAGEVTARISLYRKFKPTARNFGDVDNLAKAVLDALNGICYVDDRQVVKLVVEKHTDRLNPRVGIELSEIGA